MTKTKKTPKRIAADIYDQYWSDVSRRPASNKDPLPDIRPLIEAALIAAAEEEREGCAKICDREAAIYAKGGSPEDIHGYPSEFREVCNSAKRIAQEIRARGRS